MKVSAQLCANAAMAAVTREPPITYQMEDCQKFIEETVKRAGGQMQDYAGSNDMYRNACVNILLLDKVDPEPGMLLFIVDLKGEHENYKDGLGNAWHVGMYTGGIYEVVHSSKTKGGVAASTLRNGWTHAGWAKGLEYNMISEDGTIPFEPRNDNDVGWINLPPGENTFHRISPSKNSKWWGRIGGGEQVIVAGFKSGWTRVIYGGHDGYVLDKFIRQNAAPENPAEPDVGVIDPPGVDKSALITELKGLLDRALTITRLLQGDVK